MSKFTQSEILTFSGPGWAKMFFIRLRPDRCFFLCLGPGPSLENFGPTRPLWQTFEHFYKFLFYEKTKNIFTIDCLLKMISLLTLLLGKFSLKSTANTYLRQSFFLINFFFHSYCNLQNFSLWLNSYDIPKKQLEYTNLYSN